MVPTHLVTRSERFVEEDSGVSISTVVAFLENQSHKILPIPQFSDSIEAREDLVLVEQAVQSFHQDQSM